MDDQSQTLKEWQDARRAYILNPDQAEKERLEKAQDNADRAMGINREHWDGTTTKGGQR